MHPPIDRETCQSLLTFLSGEHVVELCGGKAWLYCTQLPGDTVSAAAQTEDGLLHLFIDPSKPDAHGHARQMVREWTGVDVDCAAPGFHHIVELVSS